MILHILVEGPSEKVFLERWGPRYLSGQGHELRIHKHQGKGTLPRPDERVDPRRRGLLDQLPAKLKGFDEALDPAREGVLVLVDTDDEPPAVLRRRLQPLIDALKRPMMVHLAFATEELEAFYLGDLAALGQCYPSFDRKLARAYVPDSVVGTWEYFREVIGDPGDNKVSWAERMGTKLAVQPAKNRSPSFRDVCATLSAMTRLHEPAGDRVRSARAKPRRARVSSPSDPHGRRRR